MNSIYINLAELWMTLCLPEYSNKYRLLKLCMEYIIINGTILHLYKGKNAIFIF